MKIEQAKAISIVDYLGSIGFKPARVSGANAWYLSPLHSERTPSFKVAINLNLWYDYALSVGGSIIDLVMKMQNLSTVGEALRVLAGQRPDRSVCTWTVPKSNTNPYSDISESPIRRFPLVSYLDSRGISLQTAREECAELHYTLNGRRCYAIGFKNDSCGYELRNPRFKGCISPKDISVRPHRDHRTVAVFEGFFDYLSFMEANHSRLDLQDCIILNSVANADKAKTRLAAYDAIDLFLDNDKAGWDTSAKIQQWFGSKVVMMNSLYRDYNDFSDWHAATKAHSNHPQM